MKKSALTFIILTTNQCNLRCNYCYASKSIKDGSFAETISHQTVRNLFNEIGDLGLKEAYFNWHGGEPLLIGVEKFEMYLESQTILSKKNPDLKCYNCIQSNGSLVNKEWTLMLTKFNIPIGISFDGIEELQNAQRPFSTGDKSFEATKNGIELSNNAEISSGLLTVLTNDSVGQGVNLLNSLITLTHNVDFLPCFCLNENYEIITEKTLDPKLYGDFLLEAFDWWIDKDEPTFNIRFFEETVRTMLGGEPTICSMRRGCGDFITIATNGDVYPCDFFVGIPEFKLGNINQHKLINILSSSKYTQLIEFLETINENCLKCTYKNVCGGGCAYQTIFSPNKFFYYCSSRKRFFNHVANWINS